MSNDSVRIDDGGPAFPVGTKTIHKDHYSGKSYPESYGWEGGMSLRDYFAAKAMEGMRSNSATVGSVDDFARVAFAQADAMLAARKGGGK